MPQKDATFAASGSDLSQDPSLDHEEEALKGINLARCLTDRTEGGWGCQATRGAGHPYKKFVEAWQEVRVFA